MEKSSSKKKDFLIPGSIVLTGIIIAGAILYSGIVSPNSPNTGVTAPTPSTPVNIANVDIKNEPFIGDVNAPVTIVEWFDFQCPFCGRFDQDTLPQIVDKYVKTGKVKVVFKDFPFLGPDSKTAGVVANAVWSLYPDQYFKWQTAMFNAQDGENSGFGDMKSIISLIRSKFPSMDAAKVSALATKNQAQYEKEIEGDRREASKFGISGTPAFIIGKQAVSGAQPIGVFTQLIDAQLKKQNS
jgi:protein-disulfide isomerase